MYEGLDLTLKPIEYRLYICKNNLERTILAPLKEAYQVNQTISLGNINELSFLVPYELAKGSKKYRNKNIDYISERRIIKFQKGSYTEYYIIHKISKVMDDDSDYLSVECYSLGYQLKDRRVKNYKVTSKNASTVMTDLLANTGWKLDYVSSEFNIKYRSFDISDSILDAIQQVAETFGAVLYYNTVNRTISLYNIDDLGRDLGFSVKYGKLLKNITYEKNTAEYCTRLNIRGRSGISIHSVNPAGTGYLEDYSSVIYPFQRDANRNVISHSHNLSDDLCHALLDYQELLDSKSTEFSSLLSQKNSLEELLTTEQTNLYNLEQDLLMIEDNIAIANSSGNNPAQYIEQKNNKLREIDDQRAVVDNLERQIKTVDDQISALRTEISVENNFTPEQLDEWELHIIEQDWNNENITDPEELLEAGKLEFEKRREPKIVVDISIINLFEVITEQKNWDKLNLADTITIEHEKLGINIKAKIIRVEFDYDSGDINLTISNVKDILTDEERFIREMYKSISSSASYDSNRYIYEDTVTTNSEIYQTINNIWSATEREIRASNNNTVEISRKGIRIYDPTDPMKMLIAQNGVLAISADGGNNWKTAIRYDGIVAEQIRGVLGEFVQVRANQIIVGDEGQKISDNLIASSSAWNKAIEDANTANAILADIASDNKLTAMEKQETKKQWDIIVAEKSTIENQANSYGITTEKNNYVNAYNALRDYITPLLSNLTTTSNINGNTFRNYFKDYYDKKAILLKAISDKAVKDADAAMKEANKANSLLADISNDNKLTPSEKQETKKQWDIIVAEKPTVESQANSFGITTEKNEYVKAYNTLRDYITPLLSDLSTTSNINGSTFRNNFKNYYDKKALLLKAISGQVVQTGKLYNGVKIDAADGFVATRSDNRIRTIANATQGFKIQKNVNGTWTDVFSADGNGNLVNKGYLEVGSGNSVFKADSNGIYLGSSTFSSAPFRVDLNGNAYARTMTLSDSTFSGGKFTGDIFSDGIISGGIIEGAIIRTASRSHRRVELNENGLVTYNAYGSWEGVVIDTATWDYSGGIKLYSGGGIAAIFYARSGIPTLHAYSGRTLNIGGFPGLVNPSPVDAWGTWTFRTSIDLRYLTRLDVNTTTTAYGGSASAPSNPVGYIMININGSARKIPYYS